MKVHVVKNEKGEVIASFERRPPYAYESSGVSLEPRLEKGHTVEEVEAPEDYLSSLKAFYHQHTKK